MNLSRMRTGSVLSLALLSVAGCGGGDDSSGALSESEYRKKGNAICKSVTDKLTDIPPPGSPDEIADFLEKIIALNTEANDDFTALDPPDSLRKDHEAAVESAESQEPKLEAILERTRDAEDPQATVTREFRKLAPEVKKEIEAARRLGLKECLKSPQPGGGPDSS